MNITSGAKTFCVPANQPQPTKTYHLLLDYLKACQNVLIGNIRLFMLSFIASTFRYVINKRKYQDSSS